MVYLTPCYRRLRRDFGILSLPAMPPKPPTTNRTKVSKTTHTKKKTALKQPLSPAERLKRLFTSLCAQIDGGHFGNAVKTCDKSPFICYILASHPLTWRTVLKIEPQDQDALQTKVFLLLQTEQYGPALSLTEGNEQYLFEKTYSLYRTNQEASARKALETMKETKGQDNRGIIHLEAQLVLSRECMRNFPAHTYSAGIPGRFIPSSI